MAVTAKELAEHLSQMHKHQLRNASAYFTNLNIASMELLTQKELYSHEEFVDLESTSGTRLITKTDLASNIHHIEHVINAPFNADTVFFRDLFERKVEYTKMRFTETKDVDPDTNIDEGILRLSNDPSGLTWRIFYGRMPVQITATTSRIEVNHELAYSHLIPAAYVICVERTDPGSNKAISLRQHLEQFIKPDYKDRINDFTLEGPVSGSL